MKAKSLECLPEVFVKIDVYKAHSSSVVLYNKLHVDNSSNLTEAEILERYSYSTKISEAKGSESTIHKKTFYAERYGGDQISKNGGGGRCGFDGLFQIKGIGRTPLVGLNTDDVHSNGMLDLESAIYEAIWGEIINLILPHGAVRSLAVICLDSTFSLDGRVHQQALLVREAVVRPAHFERAIYFKEPIIPGKLCNDARRVRDSIQKINEFLPRPQKSCFQQTNSTSILSFKEGVVELSRKYAEQFAVARSKNIMHMMMSSSNIAITGAWLDLNSVTVVSHKSVNEKRLYQTFNTEYVSVLNSLKSICFNAEKYMQVTKKQSAEITDSALSNFSTAYDCELRKFLIIRSGFPHCVVEWMVSTVEFQVYSSKLLSFMEGQDYALQDEQLFGCYRFHNIKGLPHVVIEEVENRADYDVVIEWDTDNLFLKNELENAFESFYLLVVSNVNISKQALNRLICINLTRRSKTPALLQNFKLYQLILECIKKNNAGPRLKQDIELLSQEAYDTASICLGTDEGYNSLLWKEGDNTIEYDGLLDAFRIIHDYQEIILSWKEMTSSLDNLPIVKNCELFYENIKGVLFDV